VTVRCSDALARHRELVCVLVSEWRRRLAGDTPSGGESMPDAERITLKPTEGAEALRASGGGGSVGREGLVAVGEPLPHAGVGGRTGGVEMVQHDGIPRCRGTACGPCISGGGEPGDGSAAVGESTPASKLGLEHERGDGSGKSSSGEVGIVCRVGTLERRRVMPGCCASWLRGLSESPLLERATSDGCCCTAVGGLHDMVPPRLARRPTKRELLGDEKEDTPSPLAARARSITLLSPPSSGTKRLRRREAWPGECESGAPGEAPGEQSRGLGSEKLALRRGEVPGAAASAVVGAVVGAAAQVVAAAGAAIGAVAGAAASSDDAGGAAAAGAGALVRTAAAAAAKASPRRVALDAGAETGAAAAAAESAIPASLVGLVGLASAGVASAHTPGRPSMELRRARAVRSAESGEKGRGAAPVVEPARLRFGGTSFHSEPSRRANAPSRANAIEARRLSAERTMPCVRSRPTERSPAESTERLLARSPSAASMPTERMAWRISSAKFWKEMVPCGPESSPERHASTCSTHRERTQCTCRP
jgi:hypothetical protein